MKLNLIPLRQLENHIGSILEAINIYPPLHPTQPFIAFAKKNRFSFSSPNDWRWKYGLGICGKWFPHFISSSTTYEKVFPKLWIFSLPKRKVPRTWRKFMKTYLTNMSKKFLLPYINIWNTAKSMTSRLLKLHAQDLVLLKTNK